MLGHCWLLLGTILRLPLVPLYKVVVLFCLRLPTCAVTPVPLRDMLSRQFLSLLTLSLVVRASILSDVVDAFEKAVDCASCHALVGVLQGPALLGDSVLSDALIGVCELTGVSMHLQYST